MIYKPHWRIEGHGAAKTAPPQKIGKMKSHQKWVAENTTRIVMNLNHNTDKDVLKKLSQVPSKQGYIKGLIRADIAKEESSQ